MNLEALLVISKIGKEAEVPHNVTRLSYGLNLSSLQHITAHIQTASDSWYLLATLESYG